MAERRKNIRLALRFPAHLRFSGGHACEGWTRNVSFSGAFVELQDVSAATVGRACSLSIVLQEAPARRAIRLRCRVVHASPAGVGLKFVAIRSECYGHLTHLMILNSSDPAALAEEVEASPGILNEDLDEADDA